MRRGASLAGSPKLRAMLHRVHGRSRLYWMLALGLVVALIAQTALPLTVSLLIGWDVAAALHLAITWTVLTHSTADEARRWASDEDENPYVMLLLVVIVIVASLTGIVLMLLGAGEGQGVSHLLAAILTAVTMMVSWTLLHTIFVLHYAHIYFNDDHEERHAIEFPCDDQPTHREFIYFGFCIGLTYQVSDTTVTDRRIRNLVTLHGIIAFFFNTVILALAINIVGSAIS